MAPVGLLLSSRGFSFGDQRGAAMVPTSAAVTESSTRAAKPLLAEAHLIAWTRGVPSSPPVPVNSPVQSPVSQRGFPFPAVSAAISISSSSRSTNRDEKKAPTGSYAAELLDVEGLRVVKYLPGNGEALSEAAE